MTTNSYKSRTTLWDDQVSADQAAPSPGQPIPPRSTWRAPSAALSNERGSRRVVSAIPAVPLANEDIEDDSPVPRRTNFYAAKTSWWRPRTRLGRIVLGSGVFAVSAVVVFAGISARNFVLRDAHFRIPGVGSIQSTGLSEVNRTEILPVFGEDIGRNIFFVPLVQRRKELEAIPWVKQATVMRFLPDSLSVSIVERTPVALVRQDQQVKLTDSDGVILDMSPAMMARHHYSFPVITGIDAKDSLAARRVRMAVYQRFVAELDQNQRHLTDQVSEIDLSDPEDLRATMTEPGMDILAHFGEDQFLHRLQVYHEHIAEWRQRYPKLIGVDLRYNGEVPLEMASENSSDDATKLSAIGSGSAAKPAAIKAIKTATAHSAAHPVMKPAVKPTVSASQRKAAEVRAKEARLKAIKTKAAHDKAVRSKAIAHPAVKQGQ